jgi:hypothetical protein
MPSSMPLPTESEILGHSRFLRWHRLHATKLASGMNGRGRDQPYSGTPNIVKLNVEFEGIVLRTPA